jgi:RNA polymerase subunit RPABC4/transcription elongation factor Spt4
MQCKKCNSKWEIDQSISGSLICCPFCGASLADEGDVETKTFDNSQDALIYIAQKYGSEVLLGKKIKYIFPDYAPQVSRKKLVFAVYENGAASILQNNLNSQQADQEIAFKQAVAKLINDAFIAPEAAESIIREFTSALGWQLSMPMQQQAVMQSQTQRSSTSPSETRSVTGCYSTTGEYAQPDLVNIPDSRVKSFLGSMGDRLSGRKRSVQFGGYQWRVLDIQSNRTLLLTDDIIEKRPYNMKWKGVTWEDCTLRHYLNNEFYNRFSGQEQAMILETKNTNANNPWYGTNGGGDTTDKIFMLSIEEVVRYFGDSGQLKNNNFDQQVWGSKTGHSDDIEMRRSTGTEKAYACPKCGNIIEYGVKFCPYCSMPIAWEGFVSFVHENAKATQTLSAQNATAWVSDKFNGERVANYGDKAWCWWLRSSGYNGAHAANIYIDGFLGVDGGYVSHDEGGVRPALWLLLPFVF